MPEFVPYPRLIPGCDTMGLLDEHAIDAEGFVTPSVVCPKECGFHEMIFLEGWHGD